MPALLPLQTQQASCGHHRAGEGKQPSMPLRSQLWCSTNQTGGQTPWTKTLPLSAEYPARRHPCILHQALHPERATRGPLQSTPMAPCPQKPLPSFMNVPGTSPEAADPLAADLNGAPAAWSPGRSPRTMAAGSTQRKGCIGPHAVQDAPARWATRPLEQNVNLIIFEDCNIHLSVSADVT